MLTKEEKSKWIEALRSGKYRQGDTYLCQSDDKSFQNERYCCLGVLCDIRQYEY